MTEIGELRKAREIGEIRKAREIGEIGTNKYIWQACADCGKERWVFKEYGIICIVKDKKGGKR